MHQIYYLSEEEKKEWEKRFSPSISLLRPTLRGVLQDPKSSEI